MIPVNYVDFDLDDINIPPRSVLYSLEPIGIGTPYVESLTSYISRLAECHSVNLTTLVCRTFISYIKTESRKKSFMNGSLGPKTNYINGNSPISLEYVSALEELTTRNDLIYLTMNSWSGLFSNNVIGESRKWCPSCLEEAKNNGSDIYEPLIWYIKDIQLCDKHQVQLEDTCPKCEKKLNFLHANFIVGHCQYCFTWLGYESKSSIGGNLKYQEFLLDSFKPLIESAMYLDTLPTNLRIGYLIRGIMEDNYFYRYSEFANLLGLHQSIIHLWIKNKRKPSIDSLFKIYQKVNLSIYEMFATSINDDLNIEKPIIMKNKNLTLDELENELKNELENNNYGSLSKLSIAKGFGASRARKYFPKLCEEIRNRYLLNEEELKERKRIEIERSLMDALEMEPPISLYQFSEDFRISEIKAKNYCSELSKKLINRHRSYVKKRKKIRDETLKNEIKQVVLELHNNGVYPSDKALRTKLTNPNCLMEPEIRRVWKKELDSLGYKK